MKQEIFALGAHFRNPCLDRSVHLPYIIKLTWGQERKYFVADGISR
jgi:hypothetical protein